MSLPGSQGQKRTDREGRRKVSHGNSGGRRGGGDSGSFMLEGDLRKPGHSLKSGLMNSKHSSCYLTRKEEPGPGEWGAAHRTRHK